MMSEGISHATTAYAAHAFTMLPSGEIDVLGARSDDIMIIEGTDIYTMEFFPDPRRLTRHSRR
eukprot:7640721-Pyramimonas_sp.AAC.1